MKKILIINPFGIGDVLFSGPVIRAIKGAHPDSMICYWCNKRVCPILINNPGIDKVFALSRRDIRKIYDKSRLKGICEFLNLSRMIRSEKFDIFLDFSLDHRYSLMAKFLGIRKRIGFNYKKRGRFLTDKIDISGYNDKHVIEYYSELLKFIDIQQRDNRLELFVAEGERRCAEDMLADNGINDGDLIVGISPGAGASWGKDAWLKHWPAVKFGRLADRLIDEHNARVLILGDASEMPIARAIIGTMKNKPVDLAGKTDLKELTAVIKNLHLLITNDGGPLHIAVSLGVKSVSIFGPVDDKVYGPYPPSTNHKVIKQDLPCRPCYKNFRYNGCGNNRGCIEDITVDEVYSAAAGLISTVVISKKAGSGR